MTKTATRGQNALIFAIASLLSARVSFGQTGPDSLALSSGTAAANGSVSLNLALTSPSGSQPSAIQWTVTYPPANVVGISVTAGAALTAAGKTLSCNGASGAYTCEASAENAGIISNGSVAVVNLTMAAGLTTTAIGIGNSAESSPTGSGIVVLSTGGTVTGGAVLPTVSSLACLPATLSSNSSSTCTVTLTQAAPTGGALVTLTNTNTALTAPASVTVAAAATTATFNATTAALASNQSATLKATYNSTSASATISMVAVLVSSLAAIPLLWDRTPPAPALSP